MLMNDWLDVSGDQAQIRREREKARDLRKSVWWQQQCQPGLCHYCKHNVGEEALTMDHIVPVSRGGTSTKGNVVPACKDCNNKKAILTPAEQILNGLEEENPMLFSDPAEQAEEAPSGEEAAAVRKLYIVHPHGFCSGVARAVRMAEAALEQTPEGAIIYCLNEIVHNQHVVSLLSKRGMIFVKCVDAVPEGAHLLFSAHGVSPLVRQQAAARNLIVLDATCPFVVKVHEEVRRFTSSGMNVICIGHRNHEEIIGVVGESPEQVRVVENADEVPRLDLPIEKPVAVVTQTTLGEAQVEEVMRALRTWFTHLVCPPYADICYATRDRQRAVRDLAKQCDAVIVLGSSNSSNSQRLVETAQAGGAEAILISDLSQLHDHDWSRYRTMGVTSGASTPETFLEEAVEAWVRLGFQPSEPPASQHS